MIRCTSIVLALLLSFTGSTLGGEVKMTPKEECEKLMNTLLPFAEQMLSKYGEFYPLGGVMSVDGDISPTAVYDGNEPPPSQEMINLLKESFQSDARAGKIKASAIVYDTYIILPNSSKKTDAVCVRLDHKDNYSAEVFFPYTIGKDKKVVFQSVFAQQGSGDIFGKKN